MFDDFDALVEAARMGHNKTAEHELWNAAMGLSSWYFIANSSAEDAEPVVGALEGKPFILVFTEQERAADFTKRRAAHRGNEDTPVLEMEIPEAVAYFKSLRDAGVEGALFNSGKFSFQASMTRIMDLHSRRAR